MKTDKYIYIKIALDEVKSMETFIYYMKKKRFSDNKTLSTQNIDWFIYSLDVFNHFKNALLHATTHWNSLFNQFPPHIR